MYAFHQQVAENRNDIINTSNMDQPHQVRRTLWATKKSDDIDDGYWWPPHISDTEFSVMSARYVHKQKANSETSRQLTTTQCHGGPCASIEWIL